MSAATTFHSATSSDAEILIAFQKIADELVQFVEQCPVTVEVMHGYRANPTIALSEIQSERFKEHAFFFPLEIQPGGC